MFTTATLIASLLFTNIALQILIFLLFVRRGRLTEYQARPSMVPIKKLEEGKVLAVLQELQRLMGPNTFPYALSLIDLASLIRAVQAEFGQEAEIERVIQVLVRRVLQKQRGLTAHNTAPKRSKDLAYSTR